MCFCFFTFAFFFLHCLVGAHVNVHALLLEKCAGHDSTSQKLQHLRETTAYRSELSVHTHQLPRQHLTQSMLFTLSTVNSYHKLFFSLGWLINNHASFQD